MNVGNNPTSDLAAIRSNIASSLNAGELTLTKPSLPGHTAIRLELTSNNTSPNTVIALARKVKTVASTIINSTTTYEVTVSKTNIFTRTIRKLFKDDEVFKVTIKSKIQDQGGYQVTIFKLTKEIKIDKTTNNSQPNPASSPRQSTSLSMRTNIPQSVLEEFEPDESTIEGGKVPPEFKLDESLRSGLNSDNVYSNLSSMGTSQFQEKTGDGLGAVVKSFEDEPEPQKDLNDSKPLADPAINSNNAKLLTPSTGRSSQNATPQPLTGSLPKSNPVVFPDLNIGDANNQEPPELPIPIREGGQEFKLQAPNRYEVEAEYEDPQTSIRKTASPAIHLRIEPNDAINVANGISQTMTEEMIKRQIQQANVSQNLGLTEEKISKYAQAILAGGDRAIAEAKQSGTKTIVDTDIEGIQIMATKKGALSVSVGFLGAGDYKVTYKFVQIFGRDTSPLAANSQARKSAAIGEFNPITAQTTEAMRDSAAQEKLNELKIHKRLTTKRKEAIARGEPDPLPNVATGKKVRRKTVKNISEKAITLKLYNGGAVDTLLDGHLTPRERSSICRDALKGVAQLHKEGVIHRDLKSDNLLFEEVNQILPEDQWPQNLDPKNPPEGYTVKLKPDGTIESVNKKERHVVVADLGKASPYAEGERYPTGEGGLALFGPIRPPNYLKKNKFDLPLDIYAAGRMVYQIFADIPIAKLPTLTPIKNDQVPSFQNAIANWTAPAEQKTTPAEQKSNASDGENNETSGEEISKVNARVKAETPVARRTNTYTEEDDETSDEGMSKVDARVEAETPVARRTNTYAGEDDEKLDEEISNVSTEDNKETSVSPKTTFYAGEEEVKPAAGMSTVDVIVKEDLVAKKEKLLEQKKVLERQSYSFDVNADNDRDSNEIISDIQVLEKKIEELDHELNTISIPQYQALIPQNWANWDKIPSKVQEFILKMVDLDPANRPTAEECVQFFENLTDEELTK